MTLYLLDTNMVSYIVTGQSEVARDRMEDAQLSGKCCISAVTEGEIHYGMALRPNAVAFKAVMDSFLGSIRVLPWGRNEAQVYGALRARLKVSGTPMGGLGLLIAAHAISVNATLVTNDKAFGRISELGASVNWATDLLDY